MRISNCTAYPGKGLYPLVTVPMLGLYGLIAVFLARQGIVYLLSISIIL